MPSLQAVLAWAAVRVHAQRRPSEAGQRVSTCRSLKDAESLVEQLVRWLWSRMETMFSVSGCELRNKLPRADEVLRGHNSNAMKGFEKEKKTYSVAFDAVAIVEAFAAAAPRTHVRILA